MACRCTHVPVGRLLPLIGPMPSWALSVPFSKRRLMRGDLSPHLICLFRPTWIKWGGAKPKQFVIVVMLTLCGSPQDPNRTTVTWGFKDQVRCQKSLGECAHVLIPLIPAQAYMYCKNACSYSWAGKKWPRDSPWQPVTARDSPWQPVTGGFRRFSNVAKFQLHWFEMFRMSLKYDNI